MALTLEEFLTVAKSHGAEFAKPATRNEMCFANTNLQNLKIAMLPNFMLSLYEKTGGINLGTGYIFGPNEITSLRYPTPSIFEINKNISEFKQRLQNKTIFGKNDLFWFAFDAFGTCFMLDNVSLIPLKKYEDGYKALLDCLLGGKL